jgi:radical SAM superfamily enzyme YgiQ (UPF0313 family)
MDALIISPGGREKIYQGLGHNLTAIEPPLWARIIAGYLIDRQHTLEIIDTEALAWGEKKTAEYVATLAPRLVVMVVFGHQPSASTQMMVSAGSICREIKAQAPEQEIIIVGGHVSALPELTLNQEHVDFVCVGEGPETIDMLLRCKQASSTNYQSVPGLVWKQNGLIQRTERAALVKDLDKDYHGNVWHLLPMEKYRAHNWQCFDDLSKRQPYASVYTTLGCPYKCVFCCINAPFESSSYRCRQPESVVAEIDYLFHEFGVSTFKIIDEMFVLKDRHYLKICELLAQKTYARQLNIWAYARVDTVKAENLAVMRAAGIRWLALGIESGSELVRDGADKALSQQDIKSVVRDIQQAGIYVIGNYIFGLPDDTAESMLETLNLAKELNCEFANFYSAMAYPGSKLFQLATQKGWSLPEAWSGYSQHSYDCLPLPTNTLSSAEVLAFRDQAFHDYFENPSYLDMVQNVFGLETRLHIEEMSLTRLNRKILEECLT